MLAQIGEFAFVLLSRASNLGIIEVLSPYTSGLALLFRKNKDLLVLFTFSVMPYLCRSLHIHKHTGDWSCFITGQAITDCQTLKLYLIPWAYRNLVYTFQLGKSEGKCASVDILSLVVKLCHLQLFTGSAVSPANYVFFNHVGENVPPPAWNNSPQSGKFSLDSLSCYSDNAALPPFTILPTPHTHPP